MTCSGKESGAWGEGPQVPVRTTRGAPANGPWGFTMKRSDALVCWFQECGRNSVQQVGGKNASLGELINAEVPVPPGFAVTTAGWRSFFAAAGIAETAPAVLAKLDANDMDALEQAGRTIRAGIEATAFPTELRDEIHAYYQQLSDRCGSPAVPVAVRSSATAEDLPGASFAGQQDTYLWIEGTDALLTHIARCFASLFTARAIAYRIRMGFDHLRVSLSVGVQKMANAAAAGVMFTLNPSNGDRSSIVINSNFGFGESVVSGEVTPDEFLVNKISLELLRRTVPRKAIYYAFDPERRACVRSELPVERGTAASLLDADILELARMGKRIESHYGCPMDIEWAIDCGAASDRKIFILQARPETVWSNRDTSGVAAGKGKSALEHIMASMLAGKRLS